MLANLAHFGSRSLADAIGSRGQIFDDRRHLDAAVGWLKQSIAVNHRAGSAHSYIVVKGWRPAYPETTGYILKTFLRLAEVEEREENLAIARGLADWLITVQRPEGGIPGLDLGRAEDANVFNTGMVLLGWNAMLRRGTDGRYLKAARAAGDFLLSCLDRDGCFVRHTSHGLVHAYNVRVAWALLELGQLAGDRRYVDGANANIAWTLRQAAPNGFFRDNAFVPGGPALTHSIGYVISGLIEAYLLDARPEYLAAVTATVDSLRGLFDRRGRLVAELGEGFEELSRHICVVGYCQIAIVLLQLAAITGEGRHRTFADRLIDEAKASQWLHRPGLPWYGAVPGSRPIYGRYARLQYPNWATKFLADALLLRMTGRR